jgi:hypothetical protein
MRIACLGMMRMGACFARVVRARDCCPVGGGWPSLGSVVVCCQYCCCQCHEDADVACLCDAVFVQLHFSSCLLAVFSCVERWPVFGA